MSETRIEVIVTGDNAQATMEQLATKLQGSAEVVAGADVAQTPVDVIGSAVAASANLGTNVQNWFSEIAAAGGLQPLMTLIICAAIFLGAFAVEKVIGRLLSAQQKPISTPGTSTFQQLGFAVKWGVVQVIGLLVFYGVSLLAINAIMGSSPRAFALASVALSSVMLPRVWLFIMELLSGSRDPLRRANSLTNDEAAQIMRRALALVILFAVTAFARDFVIGVVDAKESGALFAVLTRLIDGVAASVFFVSVQKPVGKLITHALSTDPEDPVPFVRTLSRFWPVLYIFLFILQILAEARGYISGSLGEEASSLKRSFAVFVLIPFLVAALGTWRDQLLLRAEHATRGRIAGVFSLLEGAITVGAAVVILYAWNIDPFATDLEGAKRILPGLVSAAIVTVVGVSAWRTISGFLSAGTPDDAEGGDEAPDGEGGAGGSRIETVLPILRVALATLIGTVTVLLALSALGVQIAPLLAGAGILGLAVGFGAQKVVEDIISGVLYLVEDAFRKGEYIVTSEGKGVVEGIMLRSVRLRHHLGSVYTIPFSSMGTIQNQSRDWVTVKLSFEVSPTQDLEKVRKLIKKVGTELMDDPELEGQFLAPLKSQGAVALVGSNYRIGVKFTAKPGEQFLIRRKALNAIQKAFLDNNIQMAAPRVIVDTLDNAEAAAAKFVNDAAQPT